MTDNTHESPADSTPPAAARPSIALTTPFLSLAAAVIALAAFLLGYVVKDVGGGHHRPDFAIARMHDGPRALERGGTPARPHKDLDKVAAGTVTSVAGNTVTLEGPNGKAMKVTLTKNTFVVVRKAAK
jgi:hypothetical protein